MPSFAPISGPDFPKRRLFLPPTPRRPTKRDAKQRTTWTVSPGQPARYDADAGVTNPPAPPGANWWNRPVCLLLGFSARLAFGATQIAQFDSLAAADPDEGRREPVFDAKSTLGTQERPKHSDRPKLARPVLAGKNDGQ